MMEGIPLTLEFSKHLYLLGHVINNENNFPPLGLIFLVCQSLANFNSSDFENTCFEITDITFEHTLKIQAEPKLLLITILRSTGRFELRNGDLTLCRGFARTLSSEANQNNILSENLELNEALCQKEFYKELHLRRYHYSEEFQGVHKSNIDGSLTSVKFNYNWIPFLDSLLHGMTLNHPDRLCYEVTRIGYINFNPHKVLEEASRNNSFFYTKYNQNLQQISCAGVSIRRMCRIELNHTLETDSVFLSVQKFRKYFDDTELNTKLKAIEFCIRIALENVFEDAFISTESISVHEPLFYDVLVNRYKPKFRQLFHRLLKDDDNVEVQAGNYTSTVTNDDIAHLEPSHLFVDGGSRKPEEIRNHLAHNGFILYRSKTDICNSPGFALIARCNYWGDEKCFLLRKIEDKIHEYLDVAVTSADFNWIEKLQEKLTTSNSDQRIIITSDSDTSGIFGFVNSLVLEPREHQIVRMLFIAEEYQNEVTAEEKQAQLKKDLYLNFYQEQNWGTIVHHRKESIDTMRKVLNARAVVLSPGNISTIEWISSPKLQLQKRIVSVYYGALSVQDIMLATKISVSNVPSKFSNCAGIEYSGVENHKRVMGTCTSTCLSTYLQPDDNDTISFEVPSNWTLAEGATTPVAYLTVYYSLTSRGNVIPGSTLLIHTGAGAIGLAAINYAITMRCHIYTTVSSFEKRQFLKNYFPSLNDDDIFDSRSTGFEDCILEKTNGSGVDVIINTLSDERFLSSLRCLKEEGQFIEIGNKNIFKNKEIGLGIFNQNITFITINLSNLNHNSEILTAVKARFIRGVTSGEVKPVPMNIFAAQDIKTAFNYMEGGTHPGKILIQIRDDSLPRPKIEAALVRTYFYEHKSYVVIGGLGGMGLELIHFLVTRGAKRIVVTSRSGNLTGYSRYRINLWKQYGVEIYVNTFDASIVEEAKELLNFARSLSPIGGIFNVSVVLMIDFFENQTDSTFQGPLKSKEGITVQLNKLCSKTFAPELDHFVVFSSLATSRGNPGQSNYCWANSAMERICEIRKKQGLPGLAIQYGSVGDVGTYFDLYNSSIIDARFGITEQSIDSCLHTMDLLLQQDDPVVASFIPLEGISVNQTQTKTLVDAVAFVFGITDLSRVNFSATFEKLGIDSLMEAEIEHIITNWTGIDLPRKSYRDLTFSDLQSMDPKNNIEEKLSRDFDPNEYF